jgi:uncharacterized membrane protein YbhN (UPF0104 family)
MPAPDRVRRARRGHTRSMAVVRARRSRWSVAARVAIVGSVVAGVVLQRDLVVDAGGALQRLGPESVATVAACWAAWSLLRAALLHWSLRGSRWRRALLLGEIDRAAHTLPTGPVAGFAARMVVGRSFGHGPAEITVSYGVVSEAYATGLWLLVLLTAGGDLLAGRGDPVDVAAAGAAAVGIALTAAIVWVVVRPGRLTDAVVRRAVRVQRRVARRFASAGRVDLPAAVADGRIHATGVLRRKGIALLVAGVAAHVAGGVLLLAAVDGVGASVDGVAYWSMFAAVSAAVGFAPTPAGVGFAEGGLVAGLVALGVGTDEALAAVLVYRFVTVVVPLVTGGLAYGGWLTWRRRHRLGIGVLETEAADPVPGPAVATVAVPSAVGR